MQTIWSNRYKSAVSSFMQRDANPAFSPHFLMLSVFVVSRTEPRLMTIRPERFDAPNETPCSELFYDLYIAGFVDRDQEIFLTAFDLRPRSRSCMLALFDVCDRIVPLNQSALDADRIGVE